MSSILHIGGAGFIATRLRPALESAGHKVVCCDNFSGAFSARVPGAKDMYKADSTSYNAMTYVFNAVKPEIVILGVGYHWDRTGRYTPFKEGNLILSSANTMCQLLTPNVKHVYYMSHSDVYGGPETKKPISEDRKIISSTNYRGSCFLAAEKIIAQRCSELNIKLTILRLFDIVGPRVVFAHTTCRINSMIESFIRREQFGLSGADKKRDFLHVDDAVSAIVGLLEKGFSGVVNIGSGSGIVMRKLVKEMGEAIKIFNYPIEVPDMQYRPTYSAIADVSLLKSVVSGWEPTISVLDYLPEIVQFRADETVYYSNANRANVLADQRRGMP